TWKTIYKEFKKSGYTFYPKVLNAKDYGIPQNRDRLFVVGFKDKIEFEFPVPIPLKIKMHDLLEDNPNSKYLLGEKGINFVTDPKNIRKRYTQINGEIALCQKANQQFNWHGDFVTNGDPTSMQKYYLSEKVSKYVLATGTKNFY